MSWIEVKSKCVTERTFWEILKWPYNFIKGTKLCMAPNNIFNMHTASLLNYINFNFVLCLLQKSCMSRKKLRTRTKMFHKMSYQLLKRIWFGGLICLQLIPLLSTSSNSKTWMNFWPKAHTNWLGNLKKKSTVKLTTVLVFFPLFCFVLSFLRD